MEYSASELCSLLGISEQYFSKNFCKIAKIRLSKGLLIQREKNSGEWKYTLTEVEPQQVDNSYFTSRPTDSRIIEDEVWIPAYLSNLYEVSNKGRLRNAATKKIYCGSLNTYGYRIVSIEGQKHALHRIVIQSFHPVENFENMTVDHINGKRDDNRLENLRTIPKEENMKFMLLERADLNRELTRLIQIYGYEETLNILSNIQ